MEPAIRVHYHASRVKQYLKKGRALRTETTVNDTRDFVIGRRVTPEKWNALIDIGHQINQRPSPPNSRRANAHRTPRSSSAWCCRQPTTAYPHPADGSASRAPWRCSLACAPTHLHRPHEPRPPHADRRTDPRLRRAAETYDLRRLRRKGFIQRIPRTRRYELTSEGYRLAVFFTKTYTRILNPTLAELDPALPAEIANDSPITRTWRGYEHELDGRIADTALTTSKDDSPQTS
jgi:hypothetical protein